MCRECRQTPCHSMCPNASEPPVVSKCKNCGRAIRAGDEYYEIDEEDYCEDCVWSFHKIAEVDYED